MKRNEMDKELKELNQSSDESNDKSLNIYSILNKFSFDEEDEKSKSNLLSNQLESFKDIVPKESLPLTTYHNSSNTQNQHQSYNNSTKSFMIAAPQYYSNQNIYYPYQYPTPMIYNNFQSYNIIRPVYHYPLYFPYNQSPPNFQNVPNVPNLKIFPSIKDNNEIKVTTEKIKSTKATPTSNDMIIQNEHISSTNTKEKKMKYETIFEIFTYKGNLVRFINSYKGSIKLQKLLENEINETDIELILNKIKPFIGKISNHQFGNYFLQAYVKKVTFKERKQIWNFYLFRNLLEYLSNTYALYVFQALLSNLQSKFDKNELNFIITSLKSYYKDLAYSENGCTLLSKLLIFINNISDVEIKDLKPLLDFMLCDFTNLIVNKNSICILNGVVNVLACLRNADNIKEIFIKKLEFQGILNHNEYSLFSVILAKWDYCFWLNSINNFIENDSMLYITKKLIFTNINFLLILKTVFKKDSLSGMQKSSLSLNILNRMSSKLDFILTEPIGVSVFKVCIKYIEDKDGSIFNQLKLSINSLVLEEEIKNKLCKLFKKRVSD